MSYLKIIKPKITVVFDQGGGGEVRIKHPCRLCESLTISRANGRNRGMILFPNPWYDPLWGADMLPRLAESFTASPALAGLE